MLIRGQTELALVYLRNLSQRRLEITAGFVLHASILDEAREMVLSILAGFPAKVVDVTVERKRSCRLELEAKTFLNFRLKNIEAYTVNRILQAAILSAAQRSQWGVQLRCKKTHSVRLPLSLCKTMIFSATTLT